MSSAINLAGCLVVFYKRGGCCIGTYRSVLSDFVERYTASDQKKLQDRLNAR
jgi:hypothetical protein